MIGTFDYKIAVLEDDALYYLQLEFKVPKGAPADLTHGNLARLGDAFEKGLHT